MEIQTNLTRCLPVVSGFRRAAISHLTQELWGRRIAETFASFITDAGFNMTPPAPGLRLR